MTNKAKERQNIVALFKIYLIICSFKSCFVHPHVVCLTLAVLAVPVLWSPEEEKRSGVQNLFLIIQPSKVLNHMAMLCSNLTQKEQRWHYFMKHDIFYRHVQNKNSCDMHKKINNSQRIEINRLLSSLQVVVHTSQQQQFFFEGISLTVTSEINFENLDKI